MFDKDNIFKPPPHVLVGLEMPAGRAGDASLLGMNNLWSCVNLNPAVANNQRARAEGVAGRADEFRTTAPGPPAPSQKATPDARRGHSRVHLFVPSASGGPGRRAREIR